TGVVSLYVGTITTVLSRKWRRLRNGTQSAWSSFWSGRIGAKLVQIAGYKLRDRAVPANRPTEVAIAMNAEATFGSLPRAMREPRLDGSTARQDALVADLAERRDEAASRLAELVTALENVRLDLLRLRAGGGSVEGITRDIAAVRAFGDQADRLLAGGREVEE